LNLNPIRNLFKPLFGIDRREEVARFLSSILAPVSVVVFVLLVIDVLEGGWSLDTRTIFLISPLVLQPVLLLILRAGYVGEASSTFLFSFWGWLTYHAWNVGGARGIHLGGKRSRAGRNFLHYTACG